MMKKVFSARTVGFYLGFIACLAALAGAVGLVATDMGDRTFSWITIALMGGGIVFGCINGVTDLAIAPLLSTLCIGCGFCWHLYIGLPTLSDIWNGVNYIGGNAQAVMVYGGSFAAAMLLSIISCFMAQRKNIQIA